MSWLKWHIGTVTDPKFRVVSQKSRVTIRDVLAVWAAMLECAASAEARGSIDGMDREAVTVALEMDMEQFETIHAAMQGRLLEGNMLKSFTKRQAVADPTAADRKRRQREREQKTETVTTTSRVTERDVTPCHEDKIREEEIRKEDSYTGDFEKFRSVYPKRAGSDDKKLAFKGWNARMKEGHTAADMIAGAERYAAFIKHTGKAATEFVMQSATFLGPSDPPHFKEPWRAPGQPAPAAESKPLACDESLQPYAKQLMAIDGIPAYNSWFANCLVFEKEDWITLAAPTKFAADYIRRVYGNAIADIFRKAGHDQFQIGFGKPKVDA